MDSAQIDQNEKFISLKKASEILGVSIEVLLDWNENNILKPNITQTGRVVYTKDQINKFLSVQENINTAYDPNEDLLQDNIISQQKSFDSTKDETVNPLEDGDTETYKKDLNKLPITKINSPINSETDSLSTAKLFSIGLTTAVIVTVLSLSFFSPGITDKLYLLPSDKVELSESTTGSISKVADTELLKNDTGRSLATPNNNTSNSFNALGHKLNNSFENKSLNDSDNTLISLKEVDSVETNETDPFNTNLGNIFSARPNLAANSNDPGLILNGTNNNESDKEKDLLSVDLGTLIEEGSKSYNSTGNVLTFILLALTLSWAFYVYQKQPILTSASSIADSDVPLPTLSNNMIEKILEVDQKADGTVVIYFKGRDYKVSKPELNSETDQFIQRILSLTDENTKELKYDIVKDEKLILNTPLSKVVTRLGFVGTKRDLFFPRTSKNKVVFRKYLTQSELDSMKISDGKVIKEIAN